MDSNHNSTNYEIPSDTVNNYYYNLLKLRRNKLNLFFNRKCKKLKITPKYIKVKINDKSATAQTIKQKAEIMWLTRTIKDLYTKINKFTIVVYNAQLKLSKYYHTIEYTAIIEQVKIKVEKVLKKKRKIINKKLKELKHIKTLINNNSEVPKTTHKFNKRVINYTNIEFNDEENKLLQKGLKYCIHPTNDKKEYNKHLFNVENAILKTSIQDQQEIRTIFISEIAKQKTNVIANKNYSDTKVTQNITKKLEQKDAIATKADKGNTIVIMNKAEYNNKIQEYIDNNGIEKLPADPTINYNTQIKQVINQSINILSDKNIRYNKAIKPAAPTITGLPKIHKQHIPVRPLINFTTAPTYKIAKHINSMLKQYIKIESNYSLINNLDLVNKIKFVNIPNNAKLASFDITNMYTNIPIDTTINLTRNLLIQNKTKPTDTNEIINIITEITKQNYFTHNNEYYKQTEGLPMGSPLSGTLAEIYLNNFENSYIMNTANPQFKNIIYWYRYVDDIILLFKGSKRQLDKLHQHINSRQPNIKFTLETEENNKINFLDLTITNDNQKHAFKIYRKPTETDHTIPNDSHHPYQHKISAYNHMINRLNNIPMTTIDYNEELNNIKYIAKKNGYDITLIDRINNKYIAKTQIQNMTTLARSDNIAPKYVSVEYNKATSKTIQKTFNRLGYKVAFKNNNKIQQKLKNKQHRQTLDTGVYKLTCNDCNKFYIGQTGRSFSTRFKEHINDINRTDPKSNYAQHIKNEKHKYTDFDHNLTILHKTRKGHTLNRLEEFEIYRYKDSDSLLNDKLNTKTNKLYDFIIANKNRSRRSTTDN